MKAIRILIADDHPVVRKGVRALLEVHEGWEICGEAATGKEVLKQVELLKPDVLITDITMPEMNGFDAIRQIRADFPELKIVVLTMHLSKAFFSEAMKAGAGAYVLKSDLDNQLIRAMEAAYEHRPFLSPSMTEMVMEEFSGGWSQVHGHESSKAVLSTRQRQVLKLLAEGKSNKEVASALGISTRTAETHRYQIMNRLNIHTLSELVLYAVRRQLIDL